MIRNKMKEGGRHTSVGVHGSAQVRVDDIYDVGRTTSGGATTWTDQSLVESTLPATDLKLSEGLGHNVKLKGRASPFDRICDRHELHHGVNFWEHSQKWR